MDYGDTKWASWIQTPRAERWQLWRRDSLTNQDYLILYIILYWIIASHIIYKRPYINSLVLYTILYIISSSTIYSSLYQVHMGALLPSILIAIMKVFSFQKKLTKWFVCCCFLPNENTDSMLLNAVPWFYWSLTISVGWPVSLDRFDSRPLKMAPAQYSAPGIFCNGLWTSCVWWDSL